MHDDGAIARRLPQRAGLPQIDLAPGQGGQVGVSVQPRRHAAPACQGDAHAAAGQAAGDGRAGGARAAQDEGVVGGAGRGQGVIGWGGHGEGCGSG